MAKIIKNSLWMCLSGLWLLAIHSSARAGDIGAGFYCNMTQGGAKMTLGPWYSYFPYDAHFQMPAPVGLYPNWPMPFPQQTNPQQAPTPNPAQAPAGRSSMAPAPQAPEVQPVSFQGMNYSGRQVPSYWYGR